MEITITNAKKVEVKPFAPPTALSAKLRILVDPPSSAVFIYTPAQIDPIRFDGPSSTHDVPLQGKFIYVQMIAGAKTWRIEGIGWKDNLSAG